MKHHPLSTGLCIAVLFAAVAPARAQDDVRPVNPDASPEAVALLQYIHSISGKQTMGGQHCNPLVGDTRLATTEKNIGVYPALFGQDFGFSPVGTWDGINYRQRMVDDAIRRHHEGFVISFMWHAVRPIEQEPVDFRTGIQSELTDEEWADLITPGTETHERWKSQVDVIAWHLQQLRDAGVPVLWRPYHEMNGDWFWWGKKPGDDGYKKLWRMMYDRLTNFHGLNNLIWVYNCNEISGDNIDPYDAYYPGDDVVDILATDVYRGGFAQHDYDGLLEVAGGKPIAIGECGTPPTAEILAAQPKWVWFMIWGDPRGRELRDLYDSEQVLDVTELPWTTVKNPKTHHPVLKD